MQPVDLLVRHALIITQDDRRTVLADGALAVQGGKILAMGPTAVLDAAYTASQTLDATGRALFPGLLNIHTHLFQAAVKGLGEDMAVEQWVQAVTFPTANVLQPEEAYLLSLVSCLENLRSGATTIMDFMYGMRDPRAPCRGDPGHGGQRGARPLHPHRCRRRRRDGHPPGHVSAG